MRKNLPSPDRGNTSKGIVAISRPDRERALKLRQYEASQEIVELLAAEVEDDEVVMDEIARIVKKYIL